MTDRWGVLFYAIVLVFPSCKNDLDRVAAIDVPANSPDRITTQAEYLYSDSGLVRKRIRAGIISEFSGIQPRTELGDGVELTFFNPDGHAASQLTARHGEIDPEQNKMTVEEQVVFVNARGEKLETEQLTWSRDSNRVYTDRPVKITRARDIIYGQGLDASQDFGRYTIRRITGTLFIDRSDTLAPGNPDR
ncbi:MAG: LPS export ABC transporter periplasmic protein LptC [Flavobacteriales bacterium]|nr:LPS export ABC transporter periplasmic protein LptC [Flavobacteriales bacterium]